MAEKKTTTKKASQKKEAPKKTVEAPVAEATEKKAPNFKSIAGKGVDLYVESVFVNTIDVKDKAGNVQKEEDGSTKTRDIISLTARKRRDLAGEKNFGGAYVSNVELGGGRVGHSQIVSLDTLNKIREVNGQEPFTKEDVHAAAGVDKDGSKSPLVGVNDNVAFKGNVFSDDNHKGSHLINPKVDKIDAPSAPFDYNKEKDLNAEAAAKKAQEEAAKESKDAAKVASKQKEASEAEL